MKSAAAGRINSCVHGSHDQSVLTDPDTPHEDDDQSVAGDEDQIDAEEEDVQDVPDVTPLVPQLVLLLQGGDVAVKLLQVATDLLKFWQDGWAWTQRRDR